MIFCGVPHLTQRRVCSAWLASTTAVALALSLQSALAADSWLVAMANPAAVACKEAGGTISKIYTDKGEQGMCTLPSGAVCEEWAFFKGACGQDKSSSTPSAAEPVKPSSAEISK